jgi:hypothetical protein
MLIPILFISSFWIADIGNGSELVSWYNPHHDIVVLRFADGSERTVEACKYESAICECGGALSWESTIQSEADSLVRKYRRALNQ